MNLLLVIFVSAFVIALAFLGVGAAIWRQWDEGRSWLFYVDTRSGNLIPKRVKIRGGSVPWSDKRTKQEATVPLHETTRYGTTRGKGAFFVNAATMTPFKIRVQQPVNGPKDWLLADGLGGYYLNTIIKSDLDRKAFRGLDGVQHWLVQVAPYAALMLFLMVGALLFMVYRVFGAVNGAAA